MRRGRKRKKLRPLPDSVLENIKDNLDYLDRILTQIEEHKQKGGKSSDEIALDFFDAHEKGDLTRMNYKERIEYRYKKAMKQFFIERERMKRFDRIFDRRLMEQGFTPDEEMPGVWEDEMGEEYGMVSVDRA